MFAYLVILFTVIPAIELVILIKLGAVIGAFNTLTLIILTGVLGAGLARWQGFTVLQRIQDSLNRGQLPTAEMMDGVMILVGGILLLTPGLVTDSLGFLLLIPFSRLWIRLFLMRYLEVLIQRGDVRPSRPLRTPRNDFEDADFH